MSLMNSSSILGIVKLSSHGKYQHAYLVKERRKLKTFLGERQPAVLTSMGGYFFSVGVQFLFFSCMVYPSSSLEYVIKILETNNAILGSSQVHTYNIYPYILIIELFNAS